jgi:hypothetical protein
MDITQTSRSCLVIAGIACLDFSRLNNQQKALQELFRRSCRLRQTFHGTKCWQGIDFVSAGA